jgi:hypothetical protein
VTDGLIERFFGLAAPHFLVVSATLHLPIDRQRTTPDDVRAIQHELRAMTYQPEQYLGENCVPLLRRSSAEAPSGTACEQAVAHRNERCGLPGNSSREVAELIAEKRRWIATPQTAQNARERCQAIRRVNVALQPWLDDRREELTARLAEASRRLQAENVLAWREYAFCLYPESTLRGFLSGLLHRSV